MPDEEKKYRRQLPLLEVVKIEQDKCMHTLIIPISGIIICTECNATWIK